MNSLVKIMSLVSLVTLSACGTDSVENSEFAAASRSKSPAVITNAKATPINAGINPQFAGYELTGRVMTGGNRCQAEGTKVKIEEKQIGNSLYVTAFLVTPASASARMCTREFMPQYENISHQIRFNSKIITSVFVSNAESLNNTIEISSLLSTATKSVPAVVEGLTATPVNGGINPNHASYLVKAQIMLGSNSCMAIGNSPAIETRVEGKKLIVTAVKKIDPVTPAVMCPMVFAPVYAVAEGVVSYDIMRVKQVVVENYKVLGKNANLARFVQ